MTFDKHSVLLYAVTDRAWVGRQNMYQQVESALKGGVTCVQLREKAMDQQSFLREAVDICRLCHQYQVPFIVNDNVQVAIDSGADGVHVGQDDMQIEQVRRMVGPDMIIGVSAHTVQQALQAVQGGANYLGVGAVFGSTTKADATPLSRQQLRDICSAVQVPVVAIGGITQDNIGQLAGTGVDGVALVSAIFGAPDIQQRCQQLRQLSCQMVQGK